MDEVKWSYILPISKMQLQFGKFIITVGVTNTADEGRKSDLMAFVALPKRRGNVGRREPGPATSARANTNPHIVMNAIEGNGWFFKSGCAWRASYCRSYTAWAFGSRRIIRMNKCCNALKRLTEINFPSSTLFRYFTALWPRIS